ncbi:MAG: hypothetical protein IKP14_08175 [Clostridiales bacterium]|nr:hypothetical protein [Clostridiales bacterium]
MGEEKLNEKELEELAKFVFSDISQDDKYKNLKNKYKDTKDPIELYHKKSKSTPDAERWTYALNSYKYYNCFKNYDYDYKNGFMFYKDIKITADVLTGPDEIIELAIKKHNLNSSVPLKLFCIVAYTPGNLCPVMKNPGGRRGAAGGIDTCWYKLAKFLKPNETLNSIETAFGKEGNASNNLRSRCANQMFCLFPGDKLCPTIIKKNLMLDDYFDDSIKEEWKVPSTIEDSGEYVKFMEQCTLLIVKRGIRIYYNYQNKLPKGFDLNDTAKILINDLRSRCN